MEENKNMIKIATHNSSFHTDDIFACATLLLIYPNAEVIRSREKTILDTADIVFDVGEVYDPKLNRFDHHQSGGAGKRENGIPFASFGLVWKEFGEKICNDKEIVKKIDIRLCQPVDAVDNAVEIGHYLFEEIHPYTITDFFGSYKKITEPTDKEQYQIFMELVGIAKDLIVREIKNAKIILKLQKEVLEIYNTTDSKEIIILDKKIERGIWRPVLANLPEPIYVVYPSHSGDWHVEAVPQSTHSFESRKRFPLSWAGKSGSELANLTGVEDSIFSHNSGFMTIVKNKESAILMAKQCL